MEKKNNITRVKYSPPRAVFVPLKMEERLLACLKYPGNSSGYPKCTGGGSGSENNKFS